MLAHRSFEEKNTELLISCSVSNTKSSKFVLLEKYPCCAKSVCAAHKAFLYSCNDWMAMDFNHMTTLKKIETILINAINTISGPINLVGDQT